jgi:hypothetical protein
MPLVDVAISYYGKPYQTLVTLFSLLEHSRAHLGKIYLGIERKQPYEDAWAGVYWIREVFANQGVELVFNERFVPWLADNDPYALDEPTRRSVRYQAALEDTDKPYLLISHNDVLYRRDLIGPMLETLRAGPETTAGVGHIGQCWNCAAFAANVCGPERYRQYVPTKPELLALMDAHPMPRDARNRQLVEKGNVYPLPECRLNEHVCLLDVARYRQHTVPNGPVPPFGGVWDGSDTAAAWFREMVQRGLTFENFHYEPYADHAPFSAVGSGNPADNVRSLYDDIERQARQYLIDHYHPGTFSLPTRLRAGLLRARKRLGRAVVGVLQKIKK